MTAPNQAYSRALVGMSAPRVTVETHLPGGLPGFTLVGLPETAVREARDRVKSAIQNCGFDYPQGKIVVNLAPAELTKEGARFDLAIAVSILRATRQIPESTGGFEYLGELGLFGELRATRGCLCAVLALQEADPSGTTRLIVPAVNATDAGLGPGGLLLAADHLAAVAAFLRDPAGFPLQVPQATKAAPLAGTGGTEEIIGQHAAKRALLLAAAGGHHLLMVGPPGTGKTLLARRLAGLLPDLTADDAMTVAAAYSAAAQDPPPYGRPPFREPHHSASAPAIAGGSHRAMPGEITLAHRGVLFLDELPHFRPSVLDLLREPLESRRISLARAAYRTTFPAAFQLVAAMNPCPAGRTCSERACRCSPDQVRRYQGRISGPLLDRIDLHVAVPPVPGELLAGIGAAGPDAEGGPAEPSLPEQCERVRLTQGRQHARQGCLNADLPGSQVARTRFEPAARRLLQRAGERYRLSARGTHRVVRVARTIADLAGAHAVTAEHLGEALSYRAMDWDGGLGMAAF